MHRRTIQTLTGIFFLALALVACNQNENGHETHGMLSSIQHERARDLLPGAELTRKKCSTCHYLDRNIVKIGPPLKGIVGRAPTISGVPFSTWDEKALDQWLQDPVAIKQGTMMAVPGIKSAKERTAIIEYLKQF